MIGDPFGIELHSEAGSGRDLDLAIQNAYRRSLGLEPDVCADLLELMVLAGAVILPSVQARSGISTKSATKRRPAPLGCAVDQFAP